MPIVSDARGSLTVTARPQLMAKIGWACSAVVFVVFLVVAVVMKRFNAGADFDLADQIATVIIGVVVALLFVMPTYPRLIADRDGVRIRSFLGNYRTVPWNVIVDIRFPRKVRFAQLVLPADETLAIYAVQRFDKEYAVAKMAELRDLLAEVRPEG